MQRSVVSSVSTVEDEVKLFPFPAEVLFRLLSGRMAERTILAVSSDLRTIKTEYTVYQKYTPKPSGTPAGTKTARALMLAMANMAAMLKIRKINKVKKLTTNHGTNNQLFLPAIPLIIKIEAKVNKTK